MNKDDEATRATLQRIADRGSDLTKPMTIDFFVAVPDRAAGERVAASVIGLGYRVSVEVDAQTAGWTCYCTATMIPSFEAVRRVELELDRIAAPHGGHADGFGTYGNSDAS